MANRTIFGNSGHATDVTNAAGGKAYGFESKHALAQLAATGCYNQTYYASAESQLEKVKELASKVDPTFLAKVAVYAREKGYMKDAPAFLVAQLSVASPETFAKAFPRVVNNGKMLRNFLQIVRSGEAGRKSLGSGPKRMIRTWFESRSDADLFRNSIGSNPSVGDVVALAHPRPGTRERAALYAYFRGKTTCKFGEETLQVADTLPAVVKAYEAFRASPSDTIPEGIPMEMLEGLPLSEAVWREIAARASWQQTRQGLNKFARHGVFKDAGLVRRIAERLRNPDLIKKANAFPYQLLIAFKAAGESSEVPGEISLALQDAMEIATDNVPQFEGVTAVFPDVSGSTHSPVTGHRQGATSSVRVIDVAALVAACVLRKNPGALVLPFNDRVVNVRLNPRDSIMTNATKLSQLPQGGTNCAAPLMEINRAGTKVDTAIFVSDNESWVISHPGYRGTGTLAEWDKIHKRNTKARLVCIDVTPNTSTQAPDRGDILNVGGFSDSVFEVIKAFASPEGKKATHWVDMIEAVEL